MSPKDDVYFVYSTQQVEEDKAMAKRLGRQFAPGNVSIGPKTAKYSKIILQKDLDKMTAVYPDTKIVAKGILGNIKYTPLNNGFG